MRSVTITQNIFLFHTLIQISVPHTYENTTVGTKSYDTFAFLYSSAPKSRSANLLPAAIAYAVKSYNSSNESDTISQFSKKSIHMRL